MSDRSATDPTVRIASAGGPVAGDLARLAGRTAEETRVVQTGPTGVAGEAPLLLATDDGATAVYRDPGSEATEEIVRSLDDGAGIDREHAAAVATHPPAPARLPQFARGPLSVGVRRALGRCGWLDPTDAGAYRAAAGAVTADADATETLATVREVGLRGRGRGDAATDEPIAPAWETARETDGDAVVVVNANDADPRARTDRTLLLADPAAVVDGALAVAAAVDAADVLCFVNEADDLARQRLAAAVDGLSDLAGDRSVQVAVGPDEFRAAEPTMALESLEGADRIEARRRPPGPAGYGLYGRPTVVHTPRTLVQVRELLAEPEAFDPTDGDPGTRLVTVTGDVAAPATIELPTDGSLATAFDAVDFGGPFKVACVGGQFGGLTRDLDVPPSAGALRAADLGTNGVVELCDEGTCVVAFAGERISFAAEENCGRCYPDREGSRQLVDLLRDVYDGEYKDDLLRELTDVVGSSSLCQFGRHAARPVDTALSRFETEFVAHSQGRCPAGTCDVAAEAAAEGGD
ncbi:MAG: NADH-ubiquinone oxidoreductase-F iron-sulfur binding region domain-containing protein [Haloarculaceae archaeon]